MTIAKMIVHNEMEANALIKEAADPAEFHMTEWVTHSGESIFKTILYRGEELRRWKHTTSGLTLVLEVKS